MSGKPDNQQIILQLDGKGFGNRVHQVPVEGNRLDPIQEFSWNWVSFICGIPSRPSGLLSDFSLWIAVPSVYVQIVILISTLIAWLSVIGTILPLIPFVTTLLLVYKRGDNFLKLIVLYRLFCIILGVIMAL